MGSNKWSFANGAWIFGYNDKAIPDFQSSVERACQGSEVEFTNTSLGMVNTLVWDFGQDANPQTASGPGPHTVTYSTAGKKTITLTITDANGNESTISKIFTVDGDAPDYVAQIQGETVPLVNKTYTYSVQDQGDKYKWTFPTIWTVETAGDTSVKQVKIKGSLGQKEITVTPYNGCGQGQSSTLIVTVVGGIDKPYPNPSSNYVYIENTENATVYVYNNAGQLIEKIDNDSYLTTLNVADSKYHNGIYTVTIVDKDDNKRTLKIVVIK
jgi:PKD repeat protein